MYLGPAERKERDGRLLQQAAQAEAIGQARLERVLPAEVAAVRARHESGKAKATTVGPLRASLRQLASAHKVSPALAAFKDADHAYWGVVMHWRALVYKYAIRDEFAYQLPAGELRGAYLMAAYEAAIRLDPEQANFGTYFTFWRHQALVRAPEVLSLVHRDIGRHGLRACIRQISSLDVPSAEDSGLPVERLEGVWVDPLDVMAHDPGPFFEVLDAHLRHRQRKILVALRAGDTYAQIGRQFGFSREWGRQNWEAIRTIALAVMDGAPPVRPCAWVDCDSAHLSDGLCLRHAASLEPSERDLFVGRLPSADRVEDLAARVASRS